MLKDMSVPGHRHSASDIVRGTLSPARLPNTVASQADLDDLSALVADLETDKADVAHTHDDRYYTETETDALLADKADSSHTHDDRYYTESEVDDLLDPLEAAVEDTGWQDLTLINGWTNSSGTAQYRRIGHVVFLRGRVNGGSGTIATLPPGARPGSLWGAPVRLSSGINLTMLLISSAGSINPTGGASEPNLECSFPIG